MIVEKKKLSDLKPAAYNPRKISKEQLDRLKMSIEEFGVVEPVIWNKRTGNVVGGHQRLKVLTARGDKETEVVVVDLEPSKEKALNLALNKISGEWDFPMLKDLIIEIDTGDFPIELTGFDYAELEKLINYEKPGLTPEDDVPEPPKVPITKPGDLWILGDHRLLCGDSIKPEDVARVMNGEHAMLMNTDPPYGVNLDQSWRDKALGGKALGPGNARKVSNDDRVDWTETWKLFAGDVVYVWHASACHTIVADSLVLAGFDVRQQIIWNKSIMVMGRAAYHWKHEPCWYAVRKGKDAHWIGDRTQTTVWDAASPNRIMSGSKEEKTEHPTQKPVELFIRPIKNHLKLGEIAYEPFAGSGSQFIAAEQLDRRCYGLEISPFYVDVAVKRWENYTGKKAEKG